MCDKRCVTLVTGDIERMFVEHLFALTLYLRLRVAPPHEHAHTSTHEHARARASPVALVSLDPSRLRVHKRLNMNLPPVAIRDSLIPATPTLISRLRHP